MCRLLLLYSPDGLDPNPFLDKFRELSENSTEYQGHGWGCAWLADAGRWCFHHKIDPVWDDHSRSFPATRLFLAHARSAFRDEGIRVENNMPFTDGNNVFIFNGELHGVRIKVEGRIGAEKIFNYIRRFDKGDTVRAIKRGVEIIGKRSHYIRAMNFILAAPDAVHVCSLFNENPGYFQLQMAKTNNIDIICSERFPLVEQLRTDESGVDAPGQNWVAMDNHSFRTINLI